MLLSFQSLRFLPIYAGPGHETNKTDASETCGACVGEEWDGDGDSGTPCIPCTACGADEKRTSPCTSTVDTQCQACTHGETFKADATTCKTCATCAAADMKVEAVACTASSNAGCSTCVLGRENARLHYPR